MESYIYLRGLRHVDHTVFCVEKGQKFYWDPVFNHRMPYSSGQQVKRSVLDAITNALNVQPSPVTFVFDVDKKGAIGEGEVLSICDPQYVDQILGGWMFTPKSIKGQEQQRSKKRRSPLSISAMRPLHPLLAGNYSENATFDRSDKPENHKVIVRDSSGNPLNEEQIDELLKGTDRSILRKWIPDNSRATGLFIYDIAIDLRTLFCIPTTLLEPEIEKEKIEELKSNGWKTSKNIFGECLVMPKKQREEIIPAIAHALINWRITSNQSRTFSLMETLALAISDNANTLAGSIRAKLTDDLDNPKAKPILDETAGADLFVTLPCAAYIQTEIESTDALKNAEQKLIKLMMEYDYENQL
jgi:hypothetical protein